MTNLSLYKFIQKYNISYRRCENENGFDDMLVWIPFDVLEDFFKLVNIDDVYPEGMEGTVIGGTFCFWAFDLLESLNVDIDSVFEKYEEK